MKTFVVLFFSMTSLVAMANTNPTNEGFVTVADTNPNRIAELLSDSNSCSAYARYNGQLCCTVVCTRDKSAICVSNEFCYQSSCRCE